MATFTRSSDSATNEPVTVHAPFRQAREVRNIARELLHSSTVRGAFVATANRAGTLVCVYNTHSDAKTAQTFFALGSYFLYDGPDSSFDMRFIVHGGDLEIGQNVREETWELEVPFKEVPA